MQLSDTHSKDITIETVTPQNGGQYDLISAQQTPAMNSSNIWAMASTLFQRINDNFERAVNSGEKLIVALGEEHDKIEDKALQIALLSMLAKQRDDSNGPDFSLYIEADHTLLSQYGDAHHFSQNGLDLRIAPFIGHILKSKNAHSPIASASLFAHALATDIPILPVDARRFYAEQGNTDPDNTYVNVTRTGVEYDYMHHVQLTKPQKSYPRLTDSKLPSFHAASPEGMALRNLVMSENIITAMDQHKQNLGILITGAAHIAGGQSLASKLKHKNDASPSTQWIPFQNSFIDIFNRSTNNVCMLPITPKAKQVFIALDNGTRESHLSYKYNDKVSHAKLHAIIYDTVSRTAQNDHVMQSNALKSLTSAFPDDARPRFPTGEAMGYTRFKEETANQMREEACRILATTGDADGIYQQIKETTCGSFEKARFTPFEL